MDKLTTAAIWELVARPHDKKVLLGKWVFDQKFDADGNWVNNRARWVVCGNFENGEYSPHEVYSAVAHASSVRIFFNLVATMNLECHQFDVVGAFLHAIVLDDVEVYISQLTGFEDGTGRVCRLKKALYGLARSPLWWYNTLAPELNKLGFEPLSTEGCIFKTTAGTMILLYVDDVRVAAKTLTDIDITVNKLAGIFELKKMGEVPTFLGYSVVRDRENHVIYLNQINYVNKILERYGKEGLNAVKTPWIPGKFMLPKTWEPVTDATVHYQRETGSINYLVTGTRPDMAYTMMRLSEANAGPSNEHLQLLHHLWRYISGTKALGLRCGGKMNPTSDLHLRAYGDASFASDLITRASVGGHVVMINDCPVVWKSKKQVLVTLSSTEAEFINLTPTALSLLWVANIMKDAGHHRQNPLLLFTDSANARAVALNPLNTARTYHIDLRLKWIIQRLAMG